MAIDRFTSGAMDGALFSEKVSFKKSGTISIRITLSEPIENIETDIVAALEESLKDICKGLLPLGGMVAKGHGMFTGMLFRRGEEIFNYNNQKVEA